VAALSRLRAEEQEISRCASDAASSGAKSRGWKRHFTGIERRINIMVNEGMKGGKKLIGMSEAGYSRSLSSALNALERRLGGREAR